MLRREEAYGIFWVRQSLKRLDKSQTSLGQCFSGLIATVLRPYFIVNHLSVLVDRVSHHYPPGSTRNILLPSTETIHDMQMTTHS